MKIFIYESRVFRPFFLYFGLQRLLQANKEESSSDNLNNNAAWFVGANVARMDAEVLVTTESGLVGVSIFEYEMFWGDAPWVATAVRCLQTRQGSNFTSHHAGNDVNVILPSFKTHLCVFVGCLGCDIGVLFATRDLARFGAVVTDLLVCLPHLSPPREEHHNPLLLPVLSVSFHASHLRPSMHRSCLTVLVGNVCVVIRLHGERKSFHRKIKCQITSDKSNVKSHHTHHLRKPCYDFSFL